MTRLRIAVALLLLLWSTEATAARNAFVQGADVVLQGTPAKSSDVLAHLANGDPIVVSNLPTQGFYKARTSTGQVGWIDAGSVGLQAPSGGAAAPAAGGDELPAPPSSGGVDEELPAPPGGETAPSTLGSPSVPSAENPSAVPAASAPVPAASAPGLSTGADSETIPYEDVPSAVPFSTRHEEEPVKHARYPFELKVFAGMQKISLSDVNNLIAVSPFSALPYVGGQFEVPLSERVKWLIRAEYMTASTSVDSTQFSLSSVPVTTGISYVISRDRTLLISASLLAGAAFSTTLDVTNATLPEPNVTELTSTAFTETLKFDFDFPLTNSVGLLIEGGYRFLKTASIGPTIAGNGSTIFQVNSQYVPIPLDLSGPFLGAGLSFLF